MKRFACSLAVPVLSFVIAAAGQAAPSQALPLQGACTPQQAMEAEQRQDFAEAIRVYTCLCQADPKDWRPVASIAGVYGYMNRPQDEQQWAQRAIALAPQQPGPYINLGNAQAEMKNFTGARTSFRKAMQVAPTSSVGAYSLGVLADTQHNTQEAEQWYRRALTIQPRDENAEVSLAALLGNTGRVQQAIPILQKVLADNPQAQDARQMLTQMQGGGQRPILPNGTTSGGAPIERR